MKTDELIHLLAADERPVQRTAIEQRFAVASAAGIAGAGVLMLALFGLRPDLLATMALPMFWGKLVFAAALAAAGLALLRRMARPGMPLGHAVLWLAVPPLLLWAMAVAAVVFIALWMNPSTFLPCAGQCATSRPEVPHQKFSKEPHQHRFSSLPSPPLPTTSTSAASTP